MSSSTAGLMDVSVHRGETLVIPFHLRRLATDGETYDSVDMTTAGRTLTMFLTPAGGDTTEYDEATYVTWTTEASGKGYWKWTEAQVETVANFPTGQIEAVLWIEDTTQVDPKRRIGRCTITVNEDSANGLV